MTDDGQFDDCHDFETFCETLESIGYPLASAKLRTIAIPKRQPLADWDAVRQRYGDERAKKLRTDDGRLESAQSCKERLYPEFEDAMTFDQFKRAIEKPD